MGEIGRELQIVWQTFISYLSMWPRRENPLKIRSHTVTDPLYVNPVPLRVLWGPVYGDINRQGTTLSVRGKTTRLQAWRPKTTQGSILRRMDLKVLLRIVVESSLSWAVVILRPHYKKDPRVSGEGDRKKNHRGEGGVRVGEGPRGRKEWRSFRSSEN